MVTDTTFTDIFTIPNKRTFEAKEPGKMKESLDPANPPYWVRNVWPQSPPYDFALVYACVGSPLLGEYTYFFSRKPSIPAAQLDEMRRYATERNISLDSVRSVPMEGCEW